MSLEFEQSYIGTKKAYFKELFGKSADSNLTEFLAYLSENNQRSLIGEIDALTKAVQELTEKLEEGK